MSAEGRLLVEAIVAALEGASPEQRARIRDALALGPEPALRPALLTVAQAAVVLACSPRTVRRRIADGSIPAATEHGRVVIRDDELRAYVDRLDRHGPAPGHRRTRAPASRRTYALLRE